VRQSGCREHSSTALQLQVLRLQPELPFRQRHAHGSFDRHALRSSRWKHEADLGQMIFHQGMPTTF